MSTVMRMQSSCSRLVYDTLAAFGSATCCSRQDARERPVGTGDLLPVQRTMLLGLYVTRSPLDGGGDGQRASCITS